jgi:hypothetical protein
MFQAPCHEEAHKILSRIDAAMDVSIKLSDLGRLYTFSTVTSSRTFLGRPLFLFIVSTFIGGWWTLGSDSVSLPMDGVGRSA